MMKKLIFNTAKEGFRRMFRQHKAEVKAAKAAKKRGFTKGVEPYDLKKRAFKKSIRSTRFMSKADYLKLPKTKSLPRGGPKINLVGKAYASDKKGKSMNITLPKKEREAIQRSISQSVRRFMSEKIGRKLKGGVIRAKKGRFI
tara:strand:- start:177 stop:605 length:429 start_codon:yes stop_codon:yes gene_type:complete